jgi:DNA polymerase III subunit alpha
MSYAHLHVHSEYSNLDGAARIAENVARAVECGCAACGLTDHKVVSGHLELAKECEKAGIKPIFGVEAYLGVKRKGVEVKGQERDQAHQVLFAMTDEGLKNLWRIVDSAAKNERFHWVDRITWDALERHSKGVCATSSCIQGKVPQGLLQDDYEPLNRSLEIFGDNYFIELHTYPTEEQQQLNLMLAQVAQERGIPVVFANDSHYATPDQYEYFDVYIARQTGQSIYTPIEDRKMWHPNALYMHTEDEIRKALDYLPESVVDEALANTADIAERVNASLPEVRRHMPIFVPQDCPWKEQFDEAKDPKDIFEDLVWQGILTRYGDDPSQEVLDRTNMELDVLTADDQATLWHYFLLGWDTKQFCVGTTPAPSFDWVNELRGEDFREIVTGPGRGSSAGCIVAYALGITDVDPLPYDLYFERFWNPGRAKGFPDIDTDFPRLARGPKVIKYLGKRWGEDRVRQIGNISRMKPLDVIEKTGPACGATTSEINQLKKIVDRTVPDLDIHGPESIGWSEDTWPGKTIYVMHPVPGECKHGKDAECPHCHRTGEKIVEWVEKQPERRWKLLLRWLEMIDFFCGRIGGQGVHASGVIVSDTSLADEMPCRWSKDQEVPVTQFPMDDVEKRMYVKYDALGLRTLDTLEEWRKLVGREGINLEWSGLEWLNHPEEMWQLLDDGFAAGIFQVERGYPKRLCEEFRPRSVEDLSIIVALNRPGPIRSGMVDSFLRRRQGEEPVTYDDTNDPNDPKNGWLLAPILEPTYGSFVYQESIIKFFEAIGYNSSDADAIRKILGKKKPEDMRDVGLGQGEWEGKGYREVAAQIGLQPAAINVIWNRLEGFASYSFNKSHSVAYGTVGFRTLFAKYNAPVEFYLACVRTVDPQKKKEHVPRYVNEARRMGIKISPPNILKSMGDIDTIGDTIYYGFKNVKTVSTSGDFIPKLRDEYKYDVSTPGALSEALDQYTKDFDIKTLAKQAKEQGLAKPKTGKQELTSNKIDALEKVGAFDDSTETSFKLRERQENEKEYLGVILTDNAAEAYANNYDEVQACDPYEDVINSVWEDGDLRYTVPGVITNIIPKRAKKSDKAMGIVTIEYEGDEIEFVVRPDLWKSHKFLWVERTPGIFHLKHYRTDDGQEGISFEKGHKLS